MTSYSRLLAVLAASLLVSACMDASGPTRLEDTARLSLLPRFSGVSGAVEPINLIRATVESGGRLLHTQDFTVSPDDGSWDLVLDVPLTGAGGEALVTLVLIHRTPDGTELPQFSGQQTVSLTAGTVSSPQPITLFQGGPENLEVTGVTLVSAPATLLEGSSAQALATATTQGTDPPQIFWTSSDPSRATVDGQGVITGVLPGAVTITARAGAHSASADLTVRALPASVRLDAPALILTALGSAGSLRAEVLDARGQVIPGAALEWVVGDSEVAEHLGDGRFRAHAPGATSVTIRAVDRPSVEAQAVVEVAQRAARVIVEPGSAQSSAHGDEVAFTGSALDVNGHPIAGAALEWSSSNPAVATVDVAGIATTHADGQTVITASLDGASDAAILSVAQRAVAVEVDPGEHTLESLGASVHLTGTAVDPAGSPVSGVALSWSSSAPSVAQVDGSGVVTALANGTATITARTGNGATGSALITVAQRPVSLEIQPGDALIPALGGTLTFTAVGRDANGHSVATSALTWSSSNPAIATVDAAGTATGLVNGTVVITGQSGGISATATLKVEQRAARIVVTPGYAVADARGATQDFEASAFDARGNPIPDAVFTWQSMNPAVASVDENGTASASGEGSAGISAGSGDASGSGLLEVRQVAVDLTIEPGSLVIERGESGQLEARLIDRLGASVGGRSVVWTSSNAGVATVDANGLVTGVAEGPATITARAEDLTAEAAVTVEGGEGPVTEAPAVLTDLAAQCGRTLTGIAFDGTYYYVAEGGWKEMCISRYTHEGEFLDKKVFSPDFRGLHYVAATGKLVGRTYGGWGGELWEIDYAAGTAVALTSYNVAPWSVQNQPAPDPDGVTFWVRNGGMVEQRRIADNTVLTSFPASGTSYYGTDPIAVSATSIFLPGGDRVYAYSKSGELQQTYLLSKRTDQNSGYGFGTSLSGNRIMYGTGHPLARVEALTEDPPALRAAASSETEQPPVDGRPSGLSGTTLLGDPADERRKPLLPR